MRCAKFYLVGVAGMVVHLGLLLLLVRVFQTPYPAATVLAVEAAVLHNFLWHRIWTWADRPVRGVATWRRLARFHGTNGVVSLLGNLGMMQLFAEFIGLDAMVAGFLSIVSCAVLNYLLSERYVFFEGAPARARRCGPHEV